MKPMRFRVLRGAVDKPVRVFLEDGVELTGFDRVELSAEPEWDYMPLHAITDRLTPPDRMVPTRLVIQFANPEIEYIDEVPQK